MERDSFTKKYNFRLPDRTIEQLDRLVTEGKARNRTEAVTLAVDRLYMQEMFGPNVFDRVNSTAAFVVKHPEFINRLLVDIKDPQKKEEYEKLLKEEISKKTPR
jgi:Arc/MetJ-type ribon-helix-helix transcriptional regulator